MSKAQADHRIDEFAFILLGAIVLVLMLSIAFLTPSGALIVSPKDINVVMFPTQTKVISINLNGTASNVTLSATGEVADWFTFNRQQFDVNGIETVNAIIKIPFNIRPGFHFGTVQVDRTGETQRIPVTINVSLIPPQDVTRTIFFDDFKVSYLVGPQTIDAVNDIEISKSYFSENSVKLIGLLDDDTLNIVTDGFIRLVIVDKNNAGGLIVVFNGKEVYKTNPDLGEVIIPISRDMIGKSNVIQIKADNPGIQFWTSNVYRFRTAEFGVNVQGVSFKDLTFNVNSDEISNFKFGKISFNVRDYNKDALNDLIIKINGDTIFRGVPSLGFFSKTFGNDVTLNEGDNTISFSVEKEAFYQLSDVRLTIVKSG